MKLLKKNSGGHNVLFVEPLIPVFWTSGDASRVGSLIRAWRRCTYYRFPEDMKRLRKSRFMFGKRFINYRPQRSCGKVCFHRRPVILFIGGGGGMHGGRGRRGVHGRGVHGRGACLAVRVCMAGGVHGGGGACMAGGMYGEHVWQRGDMHCAGGRGWGGMHDRRNGHCSGRYASYWNAFLSIKNIEICVLFIAEDELVLSTKDFPDVRIGDIVEIYHPDRPQYRLMYFYFHC